MVTIYLIDVWPNLMCEVENRPCHTLRRNIINKGFLITEKHHTQIKNSIGAVNFLSYYAKDRVTHKNIVGDTGVSWSCNSFREGFEYIYLVKLDNPCKLNGLS